MEIVITILIVILLAIIVFKEVKDKHARVRIASLQVQLDEHKREFDRFTKEQVTVTNLILDHTKTKLIIKRVPASSKLSLVKKKKGDELNIERLEKRIAEGRFPRSYQPSLSNKVAQFMEY